MEKCAMNSFMLIRDFVAQLRRCQYTFSGITTLRTLVELGPFVLFLEGAFLIAGSTKNGGPARTPDGAASGTGVEHRTYATASSSLSLKLTGFSSRTSIHSRRNRKRLAKAA